MGCNCLDVALDGMERHYEQIIEDQNAKIARLRQALRDAGLDLRTIMLLETGTSGSESETVKT